MVRGGRLKQDVFPAGRTNWHQQSLVTGMPGQRIARRDQAGSTACAMLGCMCYRIMPCRRLMLRFSFVGACMQARQALLQWFDAQHRVLPWRCIDAATHEDQDTQEWRNKSSGHLSQQVFAYRVWVSEVMLQQTQVCVHAQAVLSLLHVAQLHNCNKGVHTSRLARQMQWSHIAGAPQPCMCRWQL